MNDRVASVIVREKVPYYIEIEHLAHPQRWHQEIYRRSLAGASGCFVFEIIEQLGEEDLIVLAGRQGGGCSLSLSYALARPLNGTWWRVRSNNRSRSRSFGMMSFSGQKSGWEKGRVGSVI